MKNEYKLGTWRLVNPYFGDPDHPDCEKEYIRLFAIIKVFFVDEDAVSWTKVNPHEFRDVQEIQAFAEEVQRVIFNGGGIYNLDEFPKKFEGDYVERN